MKNIISFIIILLITLSACTKEVPDRAKRLEESEEKNSESIIKLWYENINENNFTDAGNLLADNYSETGYNRVEIKGKTFAEKYWREFKSKNPDVEFLFSMDNLEMGANFTFAQLNITLKDSVTGNTTNLKSLKILIKDKEGNWKIYRSFEFPVNQ
jgi:hypothetical protein